MNTYRLGKNRVDSVELKALVISRGVKIGPKVYKEMGKNHRIYSNALACNSFKLPDETIVMATDLNVHLSTISSMFSWNNLKLLKYMKEMKTPFKIEMIDNDAYLLYENEVVTPIKFFEKSNFYSQKTSSGMKYMGNSVLQGCDWVAFQCLWPCEYGEKGNACQFCFSGEQFKYKKEIYIPSVEDVVEVIDYAVKNDNVNSLQLTGGSTFDSEKEKNYVLNYLEGINNQLGINFLKGEILLYITPPDDIILIDKYFEMGASRICCSIEVWDDKLAQVITPGKRKFTTKERHLKALEYGAEKFGQGKTFSNLIIGLEPLDSLKEGASYMAERGIIPSASVWMPFGKPVMGSMKTPDIEYFRKVKDFLPIYIQNMT